jgi:hypothetical protein
MENGGGVFARPPPPKERKGILHQRFVSDKTEKRTLPDGEDWVEFRFLNFGDKCAREDALVGLSSKDAEGRMKVSIGALKLLEMNLAIVDWSFTDSQNQKIPVTEENLKKLEPEIALWMEQQITEMNPSVKERYTPKQEEIRKN